MKVLITFAFCVVTCYAHTKNLVDVPFTVETRTIGGGNRNGNFKSFPQQQPQTPRQNFGRNSQIFIQPQQQIQRQHPRQQIRGQNWGRMMQTPTIVQQPQPQQWQQPPNMRQNFQRSPQTFQQPRPQSRSRANNNNNNAPAQVFLIPFNLDNFNSQPAPVAPVPRRRSQPIMGSSPRPNNRQGTQADSIFEINLSQLQGL